MSRLVSGSAGNAGISPVSSQNERESSNRRGNDSGRNTFGILSNVG